MEETYYLKNSDNQHKIWGATATIVFHGLIFTLLMFFMLYPPNPPLEEAGMTMSLGEENMGGPSDFPVENPQPNERYTEISEQAEETPTLTQDIEDEIAINTKQTNKEKRKKTENTVPDNNNQKTEEDDKTKIELPAKVDMRAMFTRSNVSGVGGDGGRGDGEIPGNEGRPDGDPNGSPDGRGSGTHGSGTGKDGISFELAGRTIKKLPQIDDYSSETGKVVVSIVVNKNGEVIKAVPGQHGSTNISLVLLEKARQGALQTRFSPRDDGPEEQYGSMTFIFRLKP